jgi:hypothetical protein
MGALEKEFAEYKALHKYAIMKAMLMRYFRTIQQGEVNIPDFLRDDSPERLVDKELRNLVVNDINKFNSLYEKAYEELAPMLD